MKMDEMTVRAYNELLASDAPAPGGGCTAAMMAANGAALVAMVCRLTMKSKKWAEYHELAAEVCGKAEAFRTRFLELMAEDVASFDLVSSAYAMPRDTEEQKNARSAAIQAGLLASTRPPFELLESAAECLKLVAEIDGRSNANASSDLGVAAASLRAAMQGAWLNVRINIDGLKDTATAEEYRARSEAILSEALPLAETLVHC